MFFYKKANSSISIMYVCFLSVSLSIYYYQQSALFSAHESYISIYQYIKYKIRRYSKRINCYSNKCNHVLWNNIKFNRGHVYVSLYTFMSSIKISGTIFKGFVTKTLITFRSNISPSYQSYNHCMMYSRSILQSTIA